MYTSKYYTCEQIDQRLLQGYYDDAVANGFTGTIADFWVSVLSIDRVNAQLAKITPLTEEEVSTLVNDALES